MNRVTYLCDICKIQIADPHQHFCDKCQLIHEHEKAEENGSEPEKYLAIWCGICHGYFAKKEAQYWDGDGGSHLLCPGCSSDIVDSCDDDDTDSVYDKLDDLIKFNMIPFIWRNACDDDFIENQEEGMKRVACFGHNEKSPCGQEDDRYDAKTEEEIAYEVWRESVVIDTRTIENIKTT